MENLLKKIIDLNLYFYKYDKDENIFYKIYDQSTSVRELLTIISILEENNIDFEVIENEGIKLKV